MSDYFLLLKEPRRPWINPAPLKEKFLALSAQFHPDRVHQAAAPERAAAQQHFLELNAAYHCLAEPKDRLRHLLELELGAKPTDIQSVPPELMSLFFAVGQLTRQVDEFLKTSASVTAPVLKVQQFQKAQSWVSQLSPLQQNLAAQRDELLAELQGLNAYWLAVENRTADAATLPLPRLEEIYRLLGYYSRWLQQLNERVVQLSFP